MRFFNFPVLISAAVILGLSACQKPPHVPVTRETALKAATSCSLPGFLDDMDHASLVQAINQSKSYFDRLPRNTFFTFGSDRYTAEHLSATLDHFAAIWSLRLSPQKLHARLNQDFNTYMSTGSDGRGRMLFTGYYEPVIRVSRFRSEKFCYPIYRRPDDLMELDVSAFKPKCTTSRLVGRLQGRKFLPYYSRKEIDGNMVLEDRNLEIAWARDLIDVFFLHIQGSGILRFKNGDYIRVNYDGQNGRPYRSVGRMLIEQEKISSEGMSMAAIRRYLEKHPEELTRILYANPSYVFFRKASAGSHGSIGVRLTAGRSIATDARLFPKGALVFMQSKKPLLDGKGDIGFWKPYTRFGLNQDTGGAIRGPGRVDVFWGAGTFAQAAAGYTKQPGRLYFLVLKKGLAE